MYLATLQRNCELLSASIEKPTWHEIIWSNKGRFIESYFNFVLPPYRFNTGNTSCWTERSCVVSYWPNLNSIYLIFHTGLMRHYTVALNNDFLISPNNGTHAVPMTVNVNPPSIHWLVAVRSCVPSIFLFEGLAVLKGQRCCCGVSNYLPFSTNNRTMHYIMWLHSSCFGTLGSGVGDLLP
jgi:hypothetical protein